MIITHVSVTVGMTHNLGDYSNFRPEVQLSAAVGPEDNASVCANRLLNEGRDLCYEQVDRVLEDNEKPAHYSTDVRYTAYECREENLMILVSDYDMQIDDALRNRVKPYHKTWHTGHRREALFDLIRSKYPDYRVIMANSQNQYDIPDVGDLFEIQIGETILIGRMKDYDSLPEFIKDSHCKFKHHHRNLDSLWKSHESSALTRAFWNGDSDLQNVVLLLPDIQDAKAAWDAKAQEKAQDSPKDDNADPFEPPDEDDDDDYDDDDEDDE